MATRANTQYMGYAYGRHALAMRVALSWLHWATERGINQLRLPRSEPFLGDLECA
jgi:hypothetical protein